MSEDEKEIFHRVKNDEKSNNKTKFGNVRENRGGGSEKTRKISNGKKFNLFSFSCVRT